MKQLYVIMVWMMLLLSSVSSWAYDVVSESDNLRTDSISDPEWYVAPVIPASLCAPMRKTVVAATCSRVEAIQTFNIDSVLTEGTYYEYDAKGNVISTTVWSYSPDGTMTGKSKNEYAFDNAGTQTMTAVYEWDNAANDWKGTEKYEYAYGIFAGEKKMISNTSLVWLNGAWVADHRYTYGYDEAGREISYFEYNRNTTTNELQPVLGHVQSWTNNLQTLDILYTSYANGQWTAGTKKEWAFDGNGTQTMYATYTMSNGAWVGSSKEAWIYGGPSAQLTLHEKYGWANNDWSKTLKEETEYAGSNIIRIENYTYANGVTTGTKKEEYAFVDGKQVQTIIYAWKNSSWVGASNETWVYNTAGKLTLHEKSAWVNDDWSKTLREETEYSGANIVRVENYSYSNGVATGTKKEEYTYTGGKKTEFVTYAWLNGTWANATKETWDFTNGKQTLHEQFVGEGANWSKTLREENEYSGANLIRVENYSYANGVATGLKYETTTYSSGKKTEFVTYTWSNGIWANATKETWGFTNDKQTLHEQFVGEGANWSKTLREENEYSGANLVRVENYSYENGVTTGTKKETYAYSGSNKTEAIVYQWANTNWVNYSKETWGYTSGKLTHHEQYTWNGDWSKTLEENTTYDGANITKIENYTYSDGVKTGIQKEEYTYTSSEKTMTVVYAWANNDWVYSTKNEAGYRDGNVEVSATNYAWNGSAWVGTGTRTQTTYDGSKIIEKLTKNWPSGATEWTNAAITTNTYNANGANIMTYNGTWNGSRWVMTSMTRTDIIKDAEDRQVLYATWRCNSDSIWQGIQKDTAAYSASGKILYLAKYTSWSKNAWVPSYKIEYEYNDADSIILNQRLNWSNNNWKGQYRYEYGFDTHGKLISYAYYDSWNTSTASWIGSSKYDYEYANNGKYALQTTYTWKNNQWQGLFRYFYYYDSDNREIEQVVQSYSNNTWQDSQRYIHEYNGNVLLTNNEYRWRNSAWLLTRMNEKTYTDDSQAKLRREITGSWSSSTGSLRSYTDKHYFYNCDPHFYTVRFVNYDGQVLANMTAQEGETPVYPGSTPTKPADTENTYTFSGWTPALAPVTANITYTATFTAIPKAYTITWKNEDGTLIDQTTAEYGTMPTHEDASKANTAEYTYTFAGWTPGIGIVTSDAEYTATFTQTKRSYVITFKNEDGSLISTAEVEYGTMPTIPTAPTKPADGANTYTFSGWDKEVVTVTEAATYTATYTATKNSYTITWKNEDGSVIESETLEYGATPSHADITKENTPEYTYTFAGWSPEIVSVTGDAEYTATYTATKKTYTITWKNEDGTVLQSGEVAYGEAPVYTGEMPSRPNTAEYTYTFSGWSSEVTTVTGEATYTATFTAKKNSYTITWLNDDNTLIDQTTVEYGAMPQHEAATKENTAEWTYAFTGWNPAVTSVTGDAEYTATFTATKNKYLITFKDEDGTTLKSEELEYGVMPTAPANPTKAATAEWTYTFAGWDKEIISVAEATTYTATFSATKNSYTITWLNEDGSEIEHETLEYGATPVHADMTKENTAEYTYAFTGWTPQVVAVTGDASYTTTFSSTANTYTITWKDENGVTLDQTTVTAGTLPAHNDPTKQNTAEYTYAFTGWTPDVVAAVADATYKATYSATKNKYTITWLNDDDTQIDQTSVEYGVVPTHEDPTKQPTAQYGYTFAGWSPAISAVTGNATYKAMYTDTINQYTISWLNDVGTLVDQTKVAYGVTPAHANIYKESDDQYDYTFVGWAPTLVPVTGDASYSAIFTTAGKFYTVTFYFEDGVTILDQMTLPYGAIPSTPYIPSIPSDANHTYTFSGWSPEIAPVTGDISYVPTFTAIPNQYTVIFRNYNGKELQRKKVDYGTIPEYEGDEPSRPATNSYTWAFEGWTPELTAVVGDATYTAVYTKVMNTYTILFYDEDGTTLLDEVTVEHGQKPTTSVIPTKEADEEYTYTFAGWSPKIAKATADAEYTATYLATPKTQGLGDVQRDDVRCTKVLLDGTIYIRRGGNTYSIDGQRVK